MNALLYTLCAFLMCAPAFAQTDWTTETSVDPITDSIGVGVYTRTYNLSASVGIMYFCDDTGMQSYIITDGYLYFDEAVDVTIRFDSEESFEVELAVSKSDSLMGILFPDARHLDVGEPSRIISDWKQADERIVIRTPNLTRIYDVGDSVEQIIDAQRKCGILPSETATSQN